MDPDKVRFVDGLKFMWDGETYESAEAAEARRKEYEEKEFETHVVEGDGAFLVYTRRVVTEVVVEGEPPSA